VTGRSKHLEIAHGIRWQIQSGDYEPGELLPTLEELDQEWEVTSPTMLRALGVLERDDTLRRGENGWTVVGDPGIGGSARG
jgi:GntR family transcriptional regulator